MKTEFQLESGYWMATTSREGMPDEWHVLDEEGDLIINLPDQLGPDWLVYSDDQQWKSVLEAVIKLVVAARDRGADNGERYGREMVARQIHGLLGIDKIERSLDAIANEVTTLANAVEISSRGRP